MGGAVRTVLKAVAEHPLRADFFSPVLPFSSASPERVSPQRLRISPCGPAHSDLLSLSHWARDALGETIPTVSELEPRPRGERWGGQGTWTKAGSYTGRCPRMCWACEVGWAKVQLGGVCLKAPHKSLRGR